MLPYISGNMYTGHRIPDVKRGRISGPFLEFSLPNRNSKWLQYLTLLCYIVKYVYCNMIYIVLVYLAINTPVETCVHKNRMSFF